LPKPDDKPRKKRGGKKFRNMREKYAMTMSRKLANTMVFGAEA
jgi:U4/U6 small nuclear ribonucleoprotein PRP31